jgi:microcystin-dependent protein
MATIGEIRIFAGNFEPSGWMFCDGRPLPISENDALFALLGTTYGGDGQTTFRLPDFRGRVPIGQGNGYLLGEGGGTEMETLTLAQMPAHTHALSASNSAPAPATMAIDVTGPTSYVPASPATKPRLYAAPGASVAMAPASIGVAGGSQPHNNMAPFLGINYIICLFGVFPSQV